MFNYDQVLERLFAGETPEDIAAEMAETLNAAVKEKDALAEKAAKEEQAAKERARVKAEAEAAERTHKIQRMRRIFEHVGLYVGEFHDENFGTEIMDKVDDDEDVWDLCEQFDEMVEGFMALVQLADKFKDPENPSKIDTSFLKELFGI